MFQHSAAGKRKREEEGGSRSRELSPRSAKAKGVMYEVGYSMPALSNIHQSEKIIKQKTKFYFRKWKFFKCCDLHGWIGANNNGLAFLSLSLLRDVIRIFWTI